MIAVVLAAGSARRFGRCKQLEMISGKMMLQTVIDELEPHFSPIVILGKNGEQIQRKLQGSHFQVVMNPHFEEGIASSIRLGIELALNQGQDLLVTLGDLPYVDRDDYADILSSYRGKPLFASFGDAVGPPCIIPLSDLPPLRELQGDKGLKNRFKEYDSISIPNGAFDIDRPSDIREGL